MWPSRIVFLLLTVAFAAGLRAPGWVQYLPFAASLVLFGLPHGAVDHPVPSRLGGLDGKGGRSRALLLLLRGGIPMLVPLLFPNAYSGVAADAVGPFGADAGVLCGIVSPAPRFVAGAALAAVAVLFLLRAAGDLAGVHRTLLPVALETLLLLAFLAVVPPVLAVGLYVALWHAPRHIARLVLLDPAPALSRFARDAAPLTGLALALLAGLYVVVPAEEGERWLASRRILGGPDGGRTVCASRPPADFALGAGVRSRFTQGKRG